MISHKYKCIFVHIPRCAGVSIDTVLNNGESLVRWDSSTKLWEQHATAMQIKKHYCNGNQFKDYFKFTIVRNPFTRLVSSCGFLRRRRSPFVNKKVLRELILREGYFKNLLDENKTDEKSNKYHQVLPAYDYIYNQGKLLVDFVGRFENLSEDWEFICEKLGVSLSLPHINKGSCLNYRDYYDEELKCIVKKKYKKDIEIFKYKF